MTEKEPGIPFRSYSPRIAELLCHHCKGPVLTVFGYGAHVFAKSSRGRLICETCAGKLASGEDLDDGF